MWYRCTALFWANFVERSDVGAAATGSSGRSLSSAQLMVWVHEVCVLALLHWAASWSPCGAAAPPTPQICAAVALFLERSLIVVHVPTALRVSGHDLCGADEHGHQGDITAVWLEESDGAIEWTVVHKQQQQQQSTLLLKLNVLADAINEFPQFPALRTLGDA